MLQRSCAGSAELTGEMLRFLTQRPRAAGKAQRRDALQLQRNRSAVQTRLESLMRYSADRLKNELRKSRACARRSAAAATEINAAEHFIAFGEQG